MPRLWGPVLFFFSLSITNCEDRFDKPVCHEMPTTWSIWWNAEGIFGIKIEPSQWLDINVAPFNRDHETNRVSIVNTYPRSGLETLPRRIHTWHNSSSQQLSLVLFINPAPSTIPLYRPPQKNQNHTQKELLYCIFLGIVDGEYLAGKFGHLAGKMKALAIDRCPSDQDISVTLSSLRLYREF